MPISGLNLQTKVNKMIKKKNKKLSLRRVLYRTTHHIWVLLTPQWRAGSWTESRAALGWQRSHSRWTGTSPHADGQCWRDAENASSPSGTGLEAEEEEEIERKGGESQGNGTKKKGKKNQFTEISFFFLKLWISVLHLELYMVYEQGEGVMGERRCEKNDKYGEEKEQPGCEGRMQWNWGKTKASSSVIKWLWWRFLKQTSAGFTSQPFITYVS